VNEIDAKKKAAFYNPAQVINRDLSLSVIQRYIDQKKEADPEANITYLEVRTERGSGRALSSFFLKKKLSKK
jgi:tRNA G26 N,N-dimethylase Trm1